jgi:AcrR family transcriptional regulator
MADNRAARGPVPTHSRDDIAVIAIDLADKEGLVAATMRRIAAQLGTGAGSLYRYIASRDELLDLMVDRSMAELGLAAAPNPRASSDWQVDILVLARQLLELYRRHPWMTQARPAASTPGPHVLDFFERGLALLAPATSSTSARMEAMAMMIGLTTLFAQQESAATTVVIRPSDDDRHPLLTAALSGQQVPARSRDELFDRVVTGALRGIVG